LTLFERRRCVAKERLETIGETWVPETPEILAYTAVPPIEALLDCSLEQRLD
jgi:hypothetical protein